MFALTFARRFLYNILEFPRDCARIVNDPMIRCAVSSGWRLKR